MGPGQSKGKTGKFDGSGGVQDDADSGKINLNINKSATKITLTVIVIF